MIRVYSAKGADVMRPFVVNLGGAMDCLLPDANGGCLATFPMADRTAFPVLSGISGVTIFPSDMSAPVPPALVSVLSQPYGVQKNDTVKQVIDKIYAVHPSFDWSSSY